MLKKIPDRLVHQASPSPNAALTIRSLGTAGFVLTGEQHTIVIDPFISRPGLLKTGLLPLVPDAAAIAREIPHADHVLVGHAHHDHVLDAPTLCMQTGAQFIGSSASCNVARAAGLPESQIQVAQAQDEFACGPGRARALQSRHGKVYFGRVTLPGDILRPPQWPPRFFHLKHGQVLNWWVQLGGVRVVHIDSADFIPEQIADAQADVLCLCAIGRKYRPDYAQQAIEIIKPRFVIPCHWDWFFDPFDNGDRMLPFVDLPGFIEEIRAAAATPIVLRTGDRFGVAAEELHSQR